MTLKIVALKKKEIDIKNQSIFFSILENLFVQNLFFNLVVSVKLKNPTKMNNNYQ